MAQLKALSVFCNLITSDVFGLEPAWRVAVRVLEDSAYEQLNVDPDSVGTAIWVDNYRSAKIVMRMALLRDSEEFALTLIHECLHLRFALLHEISDETATRETQRRLSSPFEIVIDELANITFSMFKKAYAKEWKAFVDTAVLK